MYNILHITPHMGGGVGNVISGISTAKLNNVSHKIILLEAPVNMQFANIAKDGGIDVLICPDTVEMDKHIEESDIVIIHWWHHPKTAKLLYGFPQVPARVVFWTHISNLTTPALNPRLIIEAARVLFTTDSSYEAEVFDNLTKEFLSKKTGVVPGCGGLDHFEKVEHSVHEGFNIGYLGLVDFSKLHPDFMSYCKNVDIKDARFILAGDAPVKGILDKQAQEHNITNPFIYTGYVSDAKAILKNFDVFGYLLAPFHTGTTENVILEAMAAEIPPVLIKQLVEKHIVEDGKTGILVSNPVEYGNAVRYLYENPEKRLQIGKNAREHVMNKYLKKNILDAFYNNCELAMKEQKKVSDFGGIIGSTPAQWFLSCLGNDRNIFIDSYKAYKSKRIVEINRGVLINCSPLMKLNNKSSVLHYEREFPTDIALKFWANIIREEQMKNA